MGYNQDTLRQIGTNVVISSIVAIGISVAGYRAWESIYTTVAFDSLLAFLAIIAAAWAYVSGRSSPSAYHPISLSALLIMAFIHIGSAVDQLYYPISPLLQKTPDRLTSDIVEVALLSALFLTAFLLRERELSSRVGRTIIVFLVIGSLAFYGLIFAFVLVHLPNWILQVFGVVASFFVILSLAIASSYKAAFSKELAGYNQVLLLTSFCVFGLSSIPLLFSLIAPSLVWTLSLSLQAAGYFALSLAVAVPWQLNMGISQRRAYSTTTFLCMLAVVPFIVFVLAESWIPGFNAVDIGAYFISHLEAALLSALMAFLVYAYSRRRPAWEHYPLLALFLTWSYIGLHLIIFNPGETLVTQGESLVPYIVGSLAMVALILLSIHWAENAPELPKLMQPEMWISLLLAIVIVLIWIGESVAMFIFGAYPGVLETAMGESILLVTNLIAMFIFVYLTFLLSNKRGSWESVEVITAGFLSLLIVPNILKGVFTAWTAGWWAAELLLLAGLVMGPVVLGILHLGSMFEAEESQRKATLYSDLLIHDITNYLQAIQVSLGLMDMDVTPPVVKKEALSDARLSLIRADHLIRNVRHLGMTKEIDLKAVMPTDLVSCILIAFDQTKRVNPSEEVEFNINRKRGECSVAANNLLIDVFFNLFQNAIKYSRERKEIDIDIQSIVQEGKTWWQARVTDYGIGIEPERRKSLFTRFMDGAKGTGLGLWVAKALLESFNGEISIESREPEDYTQGTVFIVILLAADDFG